MTPVLLWAALATPLALLLLCLAAPLRRRMPALLAFAPLPALAAALAAGRAATEAEVLLLGVVLALDVPGAVLLGVAALLWSAAGAYAGAYLRAKPQAGRFAVFWLLTLTGSLGVFVAADLIGFYVAFALASLAATGLVLHDGTARARHAAGVYLVLAVLGEVCLLLGLMLAAAATEGSLLLRDAAAALPTSPWRDAALALLLLGFGLKAGLVPLHVWLPLAHPAAPTPASAVLSGAIVKAGLIGMLRLLPEEAGLPGWGEALAVAGFATAFYGVAVGVTQSHPKTVLAYSTVSQMGLMSAVLGLALAAGEVAAATAPLALYAAHHALAKGALFLAVGVAGATGRHRIALVLAPAALLALGLGGLPLTGGALAKLALKAPLGAGLPALLATVSAAATTLLVAHGLRCLAASRAEDPSARPPPGLVVPAAVLALAAVAVPWVLFLAVFGGEPGDVFGPAALAEAVLPVAAGLLLAALLAWWRPRLPAVPEGDLVAPAERGLRALAAAWPALPALPAPTWPDPGGAIAVVAGVERRLQGWPAAVLALLLVAGAVAVAFALGR